MCFLFVFITLNLFFFIHVIHVALVYIDEWMTIFMYNNINQSIKQDWINQAYALCDMMIMI